MSKNEGKSSETGKMGKGARQFLMSLVATTISIILTFGTAALLDSNKKEKAKREMVMMILYDMAGSVEHVQKQDSLIRAGFEQQLAVLKNPQLLAENPFLFTRYFPFGKYTETVERIFSSNIETISTISNALFAENVSTFYQQRKTYNEEVSKKLIDELTLSISENGSIDIRNMDYVGYIYVSSSILNDMQLRLSQCKQMMNVSDSELEAYRNQRLEWTNNFQTDSTDAVLMQELSSNTKRLKEAMKTAAE